MLVSLFKVSTIVMEPILCSPDTQQHAAVHQSVAPPTGAAGLRESVPLAGPGAPGADSRHDLSTLMRQGSFYHPSTLTLVSRAKVSLTHITQQALLVFYIRRVTLMLAL